MSDAAFTGERLHLGSELFAVDLARHRAAYELARERATRGWVLDLGCGSGYGTASLAEGSARVAGIDRVAPDASSRRGKGLFVRAALEALPFPDQLFDLVVSFQVIEHLEDPGDYLDAIAGLLRPDGTALLTTPNRLTSDGVNPFHAHEYLAEELEERLRTRFEDVAIKGIGATEPVRRHLEAQSRRIRRIMRLDPLRLRDCLPRRLVEWLFAYLAILVRSRMGRVEGSPPVTWRDFPIGPADDGCLDLLAICQRPR